MDDDKSNSLNLEEFTEGITDSGLELNEEETEKLFNAFDKDGGGSVDYNEFLRAIRVSAWYIHCVYWANDMIDK